MITSILDLFEKTVAEYPTKIAIQDIKKSINFQELMQDAKAVGSRIGRIVQPSCPIVVYMEKGTDSISAFLGAVYAGDFYVPIDKGMPGERIKMIIDSLNPGAIIYDSLTEKNILEFARDIPLINYIDALNTKVDNKLLTNIRNDMKTTDLLYVLFTSGSTGIPKGVTITHGAVIDFTEWICTKYNLNENTVLCNQAPFYFDASVPDIYIPLKSGASLLIPPKSYYTFPKKILQFIAEHKVNTLVWVPSALCNVVNCRAFDVCVPESVRLVIFCGEVMPCKHLNEWKRHVPEALYVNMYGPTEATYACMYYEINRDFLDDDKLPLGKACENSEILLITDDSREARVGEIGEICILGQCLSQGYYNAWEKTREVFVQNPVNPNWMEIMYRTGDLAYINECGEMMFVGRKDFQIKRLGHRIELGEIENAIISIRKVKNACCLFNESTSEIIAIFEGELTEKKLDTSIRKKLPQYMIPSRYVRLDIMPMNLNGKIDRVRLKEEYAKE